MEKDSCDSACRLLAKHWAIAAVVSVLLHTPGFGSDEKANVRDRVRSLIAEFDEPRLWGEDDTDEITERALMLIVLDDAKSLVAERHKATALARLTLRRFAGRNDVLNTLLWHLGFRWGNSAAGIPLGDFPAGRRLVDTGAAARGPVLFWRMTRPLPDDELALRAHVLVGLDGDELDVSLFRLNTVLQECDKENSLLPLAARFRVEPELVEPYKDNLRRMIALLEDPRWPSQPIPHRAAFDPWADEREDWIQRTREPFNHERLWRTPVPTKDKHLGTERKDRDEILKTPAYASELDPFVGQRVKSLIAEFEESRPFEQAQKELEITERALILIALNEGTSFVDQEQKGAALARLTPRAHAPHDVLETLLWNIGFELRRKYSDLDPLARRPAARRLVELGRAAREPILFWRMTRPLPDYELATRAEVLFRVDTYEDDLMRHYVPVFRLKKVLKELDKPEPFLPLARPAPRERDEVEEFKRNLRRMMALLERPGKPTPSVSATDAWAKERTEWIRQTRDRLSR